MNDEVKLAWAAGLIDDEGCVRVYREHGRNKNLSPYHKLVLEVGMTSALAVSYLHSIFSCGRIYTPKMRGNRNQMWIWKVSGVDAGNILQQLLPYLIVKKAEAQLGLLFLKKSPKTKGGARLSQNIIDARDKFYHEMRALKPVNQLSQHA